MKKREKRREGCGGKETELKKKRGAGRGGSKMKYDLPPSRDVALLLSCRASTIRENVPWNKRASPDYNSEYRQNINYAIVFCFFFFFYKDVK